MAARYIATALVLRDRAWLVAPPWRGAVVVLLGVSFTAASEWYSVYRSGGWAYLRRMPFTGRGA